MGRTPYLKGMFLAIDTSTDLWKLTQERFAADQEIWLTTTSADGTPQPNPVWFIDEGPDLIIFSEPNQAKLKNIQRNPRVSVNFETSEHVQILTGTATIETFASISKELFDRYFSKYAAGLAKLDYSPERLEAEFSAVIRFTPEKLRGW